MAETTRTVVQTLDDDGNVVKEIITTVETREPEKEKAKQEVYGLYL